MFALAAFCNLGHATGVLSGDQAQYKITGPEVAILHDATRTLAVDALEQGDVASRFAPLTGPPQLGYAQEVVWLRLRLQRRQDAPQTWLLEYSNPFVNDMRLYTPSASGFTAAQAGDQFAFAQRALPYRYPVFALALPDTRVHTFYLRLDSDSTLAGELLAWQPEALQAKTQRELFWFGGVLGMIGMSLLFSLIHWLHSRERQVLLFAILTANTFCMVAVGLGLVAPFFAPTLPVVADLMAPWSLAFATLLVGVVFGEALRIRADFPRLHRLFQLAYGFALLAPFTRELGMYSVWGGPLLQIVFLWVVFSTGWVSWLRWRSHARGAGYFFAAHLFVIGSLFTGRLVFLGFLPANSLTHLSWMPGLLTFIFLVHAGIFVETQALKHERDTAFGEAQTANEVLLRERSLRAEQTEFFSFVAHELRSPLAAILLSVKNLEIEWSQPRQQLLTRTRKIKAYAERMDGLIERHLTLQRLSDAGFAPRFSPADPRTLAQASLRHVTALFEDRVFVSDFAAGLPASVSVDHDLLRMALENLLVNAAKFSPAGMAVALDVAADTALHFRVSDRGPGVPAAQRGRLFALFKQLQPPDFKAGFGIGLAIARRVAQLHGGSLNYADREGGGAVFTLSLPLSR